jgi:hypothetical protein
MLLIHSFLIKALKLKQKIFRRNMAELCSFSHRYLAFQSTRPLIPALGLRPRSPPALELPTFTGRP